MPKRRRTVGDRLAEEQKINRNQRAYGPNGLVPTGNWANGHSQPADDNPGNKEGGPANGEQLSDYEKRLQSNLYSGKDNDRLYSGANKLANNEELSKKEANAAKSRLGVEKAAPSAADDINEKLGKGYTGKGSKKSKTLSKLYSSNSGLKKKIAIAGAAAGGSVIGGIFVFLAVLPLKIEHLVQNLENHFDATSENAVDQETQNLYSRYMQKYVLPSLNKPGCTSTATSKDCVVLTGCGTTNPVCKVYQAWKQDRIEKQMADKYGWEFGNSHGRIYMKAPGLPDKGVDVTDFADGKTGNTSIFDLSSVSRSTARQAMKNSLKEATLWDKVMFRFKYGKYIETKYGIKRCVIACNIRDNFADKIANKKQAYALYTISHVIEPRSAALAQAIQCLMSPTCQPDQKSGNGQPSDGDPTNGEVQTEAGSEVEGAVDQAAQTIGSKTLDSLGGEIDKLNEAGSFSQYIVEKALAALGVSAFTKEAMTKAIPIVGWINTAAEMTGDVAGWGNKVKFFVAALKGTEMAENWGEVETVGSEAMSGHADSTEVGSFSEALSNGNSDMTASTEYQSVVNGSSQPATVPAKYSLNGTTSIQGAIEDVSGSIPKPVAELAGLWNSSLGKLLGGVSGLVCDIPGISNVCGAFGSLIGFAFKPIFTWMSNELFPAVVQVGPKVAGSTVIEPIIGGADVAFNDFAHHGLGGRKLTPTQVAQIQNQQMSQQKTAFDAMPMVARIFDTNTSYSLVSHLAMDMPTNMLTATNDGVASVLSNPIARFGDVFSSLFTKDSVFAAAQAQSDPYDVTQYGYPANDPVFSSDPQTEWDQLHCGDDSANGPTTQWNNNTTENQDTGQLENNTTDPCLLIQASVQSAGGLFDNSLLPTGSGNSD